MDERSEPGGWTLEGVLPDGRTWVIPVEPLPFRIGRQRDCQLVLNAPSVSRAHALLGGDGEGLSVRDLGSTNGTFLNGQRLEAEFPLRPGDILRLGDVEFRVGRARSSDNTTDTFMALGEAAGHGSLLPRHESEFLDLLGRGAVRVLFQPIVELATGRVAAYEAVGRGALEGLPESPEELFFVARSLGREVDLSRLLRSSAVREGSALPGSPRLFLNLHPAETFQPSLTVSLAALRAEFPQVPLVLELSEKALVEPGRMRMLKAELQDLGIGLAYDDFGAGQARLLELIQAPPDVLKFDMALVRGLHEAPPATRQMLRSLVSMAADLGVETLAEGVECEGERAACREAGFTYGQGYLFGTPAPAPPADPEATPPL